MPTTQLAATIEIDLDSIGLPSADVADESLIAQVLQGNVNAYGRIMRRYNQSMYRVARCIVKNDADAMDVIQEAHIKAYTRINDFRGESRFSTWLAAITRNEALMYLRKTRKEVAMPESEVEIIDITRDLDTPSKSSPDPECILENKELRALINKNVDQLPAEFRTVFVLRAVEQFSIQETAELLDIKPGTVKTRLFRAKRLLREQIQTTLGVASTNAYEVGGDHCDAIVRHVMIRIKMLAAIP